MTNHRSNAVTFKGNPLTLVGDELVPGAKAPDFDLVCYGPDGMQHIKRDDFTGKPLIVSVVPSLDTPVCQIQTKTFNSRVAALGDKIGALTVSLDLPFAMNRFCGAESIESMKNGSDYMDRNFDEHAPILTEITIHKNGSDYMDRNFGQNWGVLIDELKILARAVFVLDSEGVIQYAEIVPEVADEPDYEAAAAAVQKLLA